MSPESVKPTFRGSIRMAATEAEMAMTAPTERSTPPVAITTVMPIASRIGRRAVAQDVDEAAVEVALPDLHVEEPGDEDEVEEEDQGQDSEGPEQPAVARGGPAASGQRCSRAHPGDRAP